MLRDYQIEMISRLHDAWLKHRHVMVQMPTGTGKTVLLAEIIRQQGLAFSNSAGWGETGGVLVVAHRRELIEQISETLGAFGIEHGVIVSGRKVDMTKRVQVASIQTLHRMEPPSYPPKGGRLEGRTTNCEGELSFGLVVIDEAHHAQARTYRELWDRWPEAKFLGLTATPCRMSGEGFKDLFDVLLQSWPISWFIERGWLSDFEYVSARPDSMMMQQLRKLTKRGADGDYQMKEMATVMDTAESVEHLYETYDTYARGKKGIVYAIDKSHAQHIAEYYQAHGVACCWIESGTAAGERRRLVDAYRSGEIDVIVNVDIFSEGFDCPEVEFIQLARPTLSLSKYLQQVGRGMRVGDGKPHVVILDNVGLYQTFGLPTVDRDWRQMFLGQEAGKGSSDISRVVVVTDESHDRDLVNLDMVRIKSAGEKAGGLEVFLQDGRYGVMRNGNITCPAKFKSVERLQKGCGFFALGTYMSRNEREHGRLEKITTVIDRYGRDLQVKLYGQVWWSNGYFHGQLDGGNFVLVNCWDPVGNAYYDTDPHFTKVAGVEVAYSHEHNSRDLTCRKLRISTGRVSPRFNEWEMFYNKDIIIARDYLVVKRDKNHSYRISGYLDDSVVVESEGQYGYEQIMLNGSKGQHFSSLPKEVSRIANHRRMGLQRVQRD
ncbi:MAG: DEAD/DEAH box helicase [Bacteroidaceae bacterium]|nr:DEAD/DEAH box helicase [Bacteroidaceae bacterium]